MAIVQIVSDLDSRTDRQYRAIWTMERPMKKVKYLKEVNHPPHLAGNVDDEKDLSESDANMLAAEGYVEILGDA